MTTPATHSFFDLTSALPRASNYGDLSVCFDDPMATMRLMLDCAARNLPTIVLDRGCMSLSLVVRLCLSEAHVAWYHTLLIFVPQDEYAREAVSRPG